MNFEKRVIVVSGASSGMGEAVAKRLLNEGAYVVGCGIEANMKIRHPNAVYVQADLTNPEQAQAVADKAKEHTGKIDHLVCCAGVTMIGSLESTDYARFMREIQINLGGTFNLCKAVIPEMKESQGASVVTIGSDLGIRPIPERIGYCPSKAGVVMLTKCIALEYAPKIRANCVLPGLVRTPMIESRFEQAEDPAALEREFAAMYPLNRMGTLQDIEDAVCFLLGSESGFVTGEALPVCGGSLI